MYFPREETRRERNLPSSSPYLLLAARNVTFRRFSRILLSLFIHPIHVSRREANLFSLFSLRARTLSFRSRRCCTRFLFARDKTAKAVAQEIRMPRQLVVDPSCDRFAVPEESSLAVCCYVGCCCAGCDGA